MVKTPYRSGSNKGLGPHSRRLSTGVEGLDKILGGVKPGYNVLWLVPTIKEYKLFTEPFIKKTIEEDQELVYVRLDGALGLRGRRVYVLDAREYSNLQELQRAVKNLIAEKGRRTRYVFDPLHLALFKREGALLTFLRGACSSIIREGAIAYMCMRKGSRKGPILSEITAMPQVLIEVSKARGETYIQLLKGGKYSGQMFRVHRRGGDLVKGVSKIKIENDLRQAEKEWRSTFDAIKDGVSIHDLEMRIILANRALGELVGISSRELKGRKCHEVIHGTKKPIRQCPMSKCIKTKKREHVEIYEPHLQRWLSITTSPVREGNGRITRVVHVVRDITKDKVADEKLRESVLKFRSLAEKSLVGIYLIQEGVFRYVNPKLAEIFGYSVKELVDKMGPRDLTFPEDWPLVEKNLKKRIAGEVKSIRYEFRGIRKNGEIINIEVFGSRTTYQGKPAVIGTLLDITERKRSEEELRKKSAQIAVLRELDRIISSSLDIRKVYDAFAMGVKKLVDYDMISIALYDEKRDAIKIHLVRTKDRHEIPEGAWRPRKGSVIGRVISTGKPFIRKDTFAEKEFWEDDALDTGGLRSYVVMPLISKGKVIGTLNLSSSSPGTYSEKNLGVLEDLSIQLAIAVENSLLYNEIKNAYEELRKAHEELKAVDELKSNIIANVSHELRTPITIAKGAIELALIEGEAEKKDLLLNMALDALVRQNFMVGNLIEAARIEKTPKRLKLQPVDLMPLVLDSMKELKPLAVKLGVKMSVEMDKNLPLVLADTEQLRLVMRNLLHNAVKFNKEGGRAVVTARRVDGSVEVCVADTGIGIPRDNIDRIFDRFYQVNSGPTRYYGGTGMGLAIVKDILEAHGSEITVESEVGKGSKFCFRLPITDYHGRG